MTDVPPDLLIVKQDSAQQTLQENKTLPDRLQRLQLIPLVKNLFAEFPPDRFVINAQQIQECLGKQPSQLSDKESELHKSQSKILSSVNNLHKQSLDLSITMPTPKDIKKKLQELRSSKQKSQSLLTRLQNLLQETKQIQGRVEQALTNQLGALYKEQKKTYLL